MADTIVNSAADSTAQEAALIGGSMQTSIGYASIGGDSGNESTLREHLPVLLSPSQPIPANIARKGIAGTRKRE